MMLDGEFMDLKMIARNCQFKMFFRGQVPVFVKAMAFFSGEVSFSIPFQPESSGMVGH